MSESDRTADHRFWEELAQQLRVDSVRASDAAGSGHPTSSMSAADLMAVLVAKHLRYDFADPGNPNNDHLIFSKGHASPLLYSIFKATGAISVEELLSFRKAGSRVEGHPTPALPWVDVATGSLGQGLPVAVGLALTGRRLDRLGYRVWALCGDSEMAEGSMWEAFEQAAFEGLDNLTAIIDVNRLGQRGETRHGWDAEAYANRARAFGWHAIVVDGHDVGAIDHAYSEARAHGGQPTVVVARTLKGRGVKAVEDREGLHGKPIEDVDAAIAELGGMRDLRVEVTPPPADAKAHTFATGGGEPPRYDVGSEVPTRQAYGEALAALGHLRGDVVALDAEVSDSTKTKTFADAHPERFFEMYIAEQQMVAAAVGMQVRGWVPFASSFAAFLTRAYDFVRMAAVSRANLRLAGSHAGVAIGQDGPSQMGLEDVAAFRAVIGSTVVAPCDANQTTRLVGALADRPGISYMRTLRGATPVLYDPDEDFAIGGSRVLRSSEADCVCVVAAGVTVHEALRAAEVVEQDGIAARVIDCYSIKPIDAQALRAAAEATGGAIVTVEDHVPEGGLGDAVLDAIGGQGLSLRVVKLAVRSVPGSGEPEELLAAAGIDSDHIAEAIRRLVL